MLLFGAASARAAINLYAPAQDGAYARLYYGSTTYDIATFSGGIATLDTSGLSSSTAYRIDYSYDAAANWQGRVYTQDSGSYTPEFTGWFGGNMSITSVVGAVTARSYDYSNTGKRTISVTYQGATGGALSLSDLNNDDFQLDATLNVYRPSTDDADELNDAVLKPWDPDQLESGYTYSITGTSANGGLDIIEITDGGDFLHNYLGSWNTAYDRYDLYFTLQDTAGDTTYWSTYDSDGTEDGVIDNGDGTFTFTSTATGGFTELDESSPYYVFMERSLAYDGSSDQGGLSSGFDAQHTNLTAGVIPEPAAIILVLGGGGLILASRRLSGVEFGRRKARKGSE